MFGIKPRNVKGVSLEDIPTFNPNQSNTEAKWLADIIYIKLMRYFKVSWGASWLVRFGGLLLSTIPFMFREYFINKKRYSKDNKREFITLVNNLKLI